MAVTSAISDSTPDHPVTADHDTTADVKQVKSFEEILDKLGCFGPYQVLVLFLYLFMEIATAFVVFIPICVAKIASVDICTEVTAPISNFTTTSNSDIYFTPSGAESITTGYQGEDYNSTTSDVIKKSIFDDFEGVWKGNFFRYESLVDEWNLKCDQAWIPDMFTSSFMAGMFLGSLIWSQVADWYGRRPAYLCILITLFLGTALSTFSPSIYFYGVSRMLCGCGYSGFIGISCLTSIEFMTAKWRSFANCVGPFGEGIIILSVLGHFIRPWRKLYLVTLIPFVLIIPIYFCLPESPRWLLRNKKVTEALVILNQMAKWNGRPPIRRDELEAFQKQEELATESQNRQRLSYLDFLKNKQLRTKAAFIFAIFFAWNVGYFGISYNIRNVPGNLYMSLGLIGMANALGQRSSWPASEWFGRRRAVLYEMTLCAVFLVILAVLFLTMNEVNHVIILAACFVGLFGFAGTRGSLRLLAGETFPTAVRNMGLAMGGIGADIAGLLTPQTAYLGSKWPSLPFFIFALVSVLGSLVVLMMKETSGNPLSDEVEGTPKKKSSHALEKTSIC